jgi:Zn finger protein HypA/HybF involved in hydrogenase expression
MADGCCVPESEMLVVRDLNMQAPYKGGNQYARICPECQSRTFTSKRYWQTTSPRYIIPKGEDEPVAVFDCPYEDCEGEFREDERPDECPECGGELDWVDDGDEEAGGEEAEDVPDEEAAETEET